MPKPSPVSFTRRLEDAQRIHARGDAEAAVSAFVGLERERPGNPTVLHALGVALAQTGRFAEADTYLRRAVEREPKNPDYHFDLAALRDAEGRPGEAESVLRGLVKVVPDHLKAWEGIGMYRRDAGDLVAAAEAFRTAYRIQPDKLENALNAAELLPPEVGAEILAECLERFPTEESLLLPLAELFIRADQMEEAEQVLRLLQGRRPKSGLVRRHLGSVYARLRRFPDAAAALYEAILREPDDTEAWYALSQVRDAMGDSEGAAAAIDRALAIDPTNTGYVGLRARLHQHAARYEAARASLTSLPGTVRESAEVRMLSGMLMPPIPDSNEQIDAVRERWMETMAEVEARPTFVPYPWESIGLTGYFLGYQGREDRLLMEAYSRTILSISPQLEYDHEPSGSGNAKMRVGFLSAYMREHSVGRVLIRLMGALDREKFEVVLFQVMDKKGGGQEIGAAAADRTYSIPAHLEEARATIEAENLDLLIFCDLHLSPFSDSLAYSRLAPVQATTWGHPGTGGRDSLDYWISCEDWEPEGNERLYTENLVRLPRAPYVYRPPEVKGDDRPRSALGLPEDVRLYGCLQSLFKFHPDFDAMLAGILTRDPKARLLLVNGPHYTWRETFKARLSRSLDISRIHFLPVMGYRAYVEAANSCDVLLDTIHFSGGLTSLDAITLGKPLVTLRGDQMRNRMASGFYRQMGYEDLVVESRDSYVDLALRLGQDSAFRKEAQEEILGRNPVLYENLEPVRVLEDWLLSVRK